MINFAWLWFWLVFHISIAGGPFTAPANYLPNYVAPPVTSSVPFVNQPVVTSVPVNNETELWVSDIQCAPGFRYGTGPSTDIATFPCACPVGMQPVFNFIAPPNIFCGIPSTGGHIRP